MFEVISVATGEVVHVAATGADAHDYIDAQNDIWTVDGIPGHYRVVPSVYLGNATEPAYVFLPWHMAAMVNYGNLAESYGR